MTIGPREAATSLQDIATVEQRTRTAMFYAGSSAIFILWGVLVAAGHGLSAFYPRSAGTIWPVISAVGCAATVAIVAWRMRARTRDTRDWRLCWAIVVLTIFGAVWSHLLGPVLPRPMIYAFQPSLFLLGIILAGIWLGRFFVLLGLVGIALVVVGTVMPDPWMRPWMAMAQSGVLIIGGIWLARSGVPK
jgi:hypothetical protein